MPYGGLAPLSFKASADILMAMNKFLAIQIRWNSLMLSIYWLANYWWKTQILCQIYNQDIQVRHAIKEIKTYLSLRILLDDKFHNPKGKFWNPFLVSIAVTA